MRTMMTQRIGNKKLYKEMIQADWTRRLVPFSNSFAENII